MEILAASTIGLGFFLLMLIKIRAHISGLPLFGSLLHDKMLEKLNPTDKKIAISGLCIVLLGFVLLCFSF
mgnify:CR=1 FL=1